MIRKLLPLSVLLFVTACESDIIGGIGGDPDVGSMRLTVGQQTITINSSGAVSGGPITLSQGSSVSVTATFLTPEGDPEPNVTPAAFQLNVTSSGGVTFVRSNLNPFAGTLVGNNSGSSQLMFSLYNVEDDDVVFGPFSVSTTVQ